MSMLQIKNFKKHFGGVKAVNDITFRANKGEITGLIGPNGSGKSTIINLITGIILKDAGTLIVSDSVSVENIKIYDCNSYGITRTFQSVRLFDQMTVIDNILVVLSKRNIWGALFENQNNLNKDMAEDILKIVGLDKKESSLAGELSYGQRKLLEIGRIIAQDANVILLDEPFAGLFPEMVKKVSEIIKEMRKENRTIILVEHDMDVIRELCDQIIVMDSGNIIAEGRPEDVLNNRDVVDAYLGE